MSTVPGPWYADVDFCRPFLRQGGIDEAQYIAAIGEVQALMSLEEAQRQLASVGSFAAPTLHPYPGSRLEHHPLPLLLALDIRAINVWTELVRLGLALLRTRDLPGILSKRKLLLNFDQYRSTLFEIEAFAYFVAAGLSPRVRKDTPDCVLDVGGKPVNVEIRLGEANFGVALFHAISPPFVDDFGTYRIRVPSGVGGQGEKVYDIARAIQIDIEQLFSGGVEASIPRTEYQVDYSPTGARELSLSFGPDAPQTYAETLEAQVMKWLKEKDEKLLSLGSESPSVIALDIRALVWGLPRPGGKLATDAYYQRQIAARQTPEHRQAVTRGIQAFLTSAKAVRGVLTWWRKFEWELSLSEQLFEPWEVTLTTKLTHEEVPNTAALPVLFRRVYY